MITKKIFTIDGRHFTNLQEFYEEVSANLIPGASWGKNLDAFNDILYGGFGTPDEGFVLVWENSNQSRQVLGYQATIDFLQEVWQRFTQGLTDNELAARDYHLFKALTSEIGEAAVLEHVQAIQGGYRQLEHQLADAKQHIGDTIFDWIVAIFQDHPEIELRLE